MDQGLDPALFSQARFAQGTGQQLPHGAALPQAALQALLGATQEHLQPPAPQFGDLGGLALPQQQAVTPASINLWSQLLVNNPSSLAQLQNMQDAAQAEARPTSSRGRARSGGDGRQGGNNGGASVSYASRHQQAEARRRSRINERLEALRKVVPHSERANTATFLEDVLKYVQSLQQRVADLEGRLGLEPTVKCDTSVRIGAGAETEAEPSTLTGNNSAGLAAAASQSLQLLAAAQQQQAAGPVGQPAGASPQWQQQGQRQRAVDQLAQSQGGGGARSGAFPARSGVSASAAAGGDDLPSVSEELAMAAALRAPSRGNANSAAAAAMMSAESAPPAGPQNVLAHLAQQAQRQAVANITAGETGDPLTNAVLERAAQALLAQTSAAGLLRPQHAQQLLQLQGGSPIAGPLGLPPTFPTLSGQQQLQLLAQQQARTQQARSAMQQQQQQQQQLDGLGLSSGLLPPIAPSSSARTAPLPDAGASVAAGGRELSNSGRSQQTQQGLAAAAGGGDGAAGSKQGGEEQEAPGPPLAKKRRLPDRPTISL